ncbi:MAG TPA: hypothetical protein VLA68_03370 [Nitrososphaera sp.]|nr:hypothetical protein [Nitrososphaera sp.]
MITETLSHLIETVFAPLGSNMTAATPAGLLVLGMIMGLRHAMEADHVAAVSTIVTSGSKRLRTAPMLGALWGLGHTAALLVAGLIVLLLAISIPERVSGMLEFGVGVMLVFLGLTVLTGFSSGKFLRTLVRPDARHVHVHVHRDTGVVHSHEHDHGNHRHGHKSLIIGMIHGMAGSGALMLAVLATIDSVPLGLAYIAIFGAGSIASMAGMSTLIALPIAKLRSFKLDLVLRYTAAIVALIVGGGLMYELGVLERIFL